MTASNLQEELCRELEIIFKDDLFKNSLGEYQKINVFEQYLPIQHSDEEEDPIPYAIVRIESGEIETVTEPQVVVISVVFGAFDDDKKNNGHKIILGMIHKLYERFAKEPMLANKFMYREPLEWALQEEEAYPYYFGAVLMLFNTSAVRREDRFA